MLAGALRILRVRYIRALLSPELPASFPSYTPFVKLPNALFLSLVSFAAVASAFAFAACNGDDAATSTPPATPTAVQDAAPRPTSTPTRPASTATAPAATATPMPSPTPAEPTVDPLNPGATTTVNTKGIKPAGFTGQALLRDVRMGLHPENGGWDRIVWEFTGALPIAHIEYVASVSSCGPGSPVALPGTAVLKVAFENAAAHTAAGQTTFALQTVPGPGKTILSAKQTCDFEALLVWAAGIAGNRNFKVLELQNPYRLVIDVKQ